MAGTRNQVHMRIAKSCRGCSHGADAGFIKRDGVKTADFFKYDFHAHIVANCLGIDPQAGLHVFNDRQIRRPEINSENGLAWNDIAGIWRDVDVTCRADGMRCMAHCDVFDLAQDTRHREACIFAHWHRGGTGVAFVTNNCDLGPRQALAVRHDTNFFAFCF